MLEQVYRVKIHAGKLQLVVTQFINAPTGQGLDMQAEMLDMPSKLRCLCSLARLQCCTWPLSQGHTIAHQPVL